MEPVPFSFEMDAAAGLVRTRVTGMFRPGDVERYFAAQRQAVRSSGCPFGDHLALVDLRALPVQSQEVVLEFQRRLGAGGVARRAALVCGSALLRLQMNRLLADRDDARTFTDEGEAERWLRAT